MPVKEAVALDPNDPQMPPVLVIGAGITGIQGTLDLAEAGVPVILVDRKPSIGGIMAAR